MPEQEQSYAKHTKLVPMYHFVLFFLIAATLIGSFVNLYHSIGDHERLYSAALITCLSVAMIILFFLARIFPVGVQDRVIRAEENMRHHALTGKPLDPRLTVKQIVGLRFASDAELPDLARKAAEQGMSLDDIKKSVKNWRPDHSRI